MKAHYDGLTCRQKKIITDVAVRTATRLADQQKEAKQMQTISGLIHCIKTMTDFAGFEVVGRIALRDKATGKIFK